MNVLAVLLIALPCTLAASVPAANCSCSPDQYYGVIYDLPTNTLRRFAIDFTAKKLLTIGADNKTAGFRLVDFGAKKSYTSSGSFCSVNVLTDTTRYRQCAPSNANVSRVASLGPVGILPTQGYSFSENGVDITVATATNGCFPVLTRVKSVAAGLDDVTLFFDVTAGLPTPDVFNVDVSNCVAPPSVG